MMRLTEYFKKYYTNPYVIVACLYCLSNFFILLNNGLFIDDWTIYNTSPTAIEETYRGNGLWNTGVGYIYFYLSGFAHAVTVYHTITFFVYLLTSLLFYYALTFFDHLNSSQRLVIALLFVALPYNSARITIICFHYGLCLLAFVSAYCLFLYYLRKTSTILVRVLALLLFMFSFVTNSFVFLYLLIPGTIFYFRCLPFISIANCIKTLLRYLDFLLLPIVFAIVKLFFLSSTGVYKDSDYNSVTLLRIIKAPYNLFRSFCESLFGMAEIVPGDFYIWGIPLFVIVYFLIKKNVMPGQLNTENNKKLLYIGFALFIIAAIPYCLVDKYLSFYSYFDSRHQMLIGFGSSVFLLALFGVFNVRYQLTLVAVVISIFILCQINVYLEYQFDTYRQECFLNIIRKDVSFKEKRMVKLKDDTNINQSLRWRFYVYTGMLKNVYGTQYTLIISEKDYDMIKTKFKKGIAGFATEQYNLKDFKEKPFDSTLYLGNGTISYSIFNTLKLMFYERFNKTKFENEQCKLLDYHCDSL